MTLFEAILKHHRRDPQDMGPITLRRALWVPMLILGVEANWVADRLQINFTWLSYWDGCDPDVMIPYTVGFQDLTANDWEIVDGR